MTMEIHVSPLVSLMRLQFCRNRIFRWNMPECAVTELVGYSCEVRPPMLHFNYSNLSMVTIKILGGNSTGYFELTDFYGQDADKYYVTVSSAGGCPGSLRSQVQFDIQTYMGEPIVEGSTAYCQGIGTTLTASGGNGTFSG